MAHTFMKRNKKETKRNWIYSFLFIHCIFNP